MLLIISFLVQIVLISSEPACIINDPNISEDQVHVLHYASTGLNIIISAPHGGHLLPESIKNRTPGCYNVETERCEWNLNCKTGTDDDNFIRCPSQKDEDKNTLDLSKRLRKNLCKIFNNNCPALVANLLHRSKLDANRPEDEATSNQPESVKAYKAYHVAIEKEINNFEKKTNKETQFGLFIDLHGQNHSPKRVEIGYNIDSKELINVQIADVERASISGLVKLKKKKDPTKTGEDLLNNLLTGTDSLSQFLTVNNIKSVPSSSAKAPTETELYFNGGHNVWKYGSSPNKDLTNGNNGYFSYMFNSYYDVAQISGTGLNNYFSDIRKLIIVTALNEVHLRKVTDTKDMTPWIKSMDAIQLETDSVAREVDNVKKFSCDLAKALSGYFCLHYSETLSNKEVCSKVNEYDCNSEN